MKKLLTFHGKQEIKDKYIQRLKKHKEADEIVQGKYWEDGKGCAIGCTIHGDEHLKYETELGIPCIIARLEDRIFEGLSNSDAKEFPLLFLESIPVGVNTDLVFYKFMHWLLVDDKDGVIKFTISENVKVIQKVSDLMQRKIEGKIVQKGTWMNASRAAADTAYTNYYASAAAASGAVAAAYGAAAAEAVAAAADAAAASAAYAYAADVYAIYAANTADAAVGAAVTAYANYSAYADAAAAAAAASASLGISTNQTTDNTFSIAGVNFTFKTTKSAAGEIDIAASASLGISTDDAKKLYHKKMADKLIQILSECSVK